MNALTNEIALTKLIGEVRYRPNMLSFGGLSTVGGIVEDRFDEWTAKDSGHIRFFSDEDKKALRVENGIISYSEEKTHIGELAQSIKLVMRGLVQDKHISEVRRVGIRSVTVFKTGLHYDELVAILYGIFYPNNEAVKNISMDVPEGFSYYVRGSKNGYKNVVSIVPATSEEIAGNFKSGFYKETEIEDISSEANIYIDIDVSCEKPELSLTNYNDQLNGALSENKRLVQEFTNLLRTKS